MRPGAIVNLTDRVPKRLGLALYLQVFHLAARDDEVCTRCGRRLVLTACCYARTPGAPGGWWTGTRREARPTYPLYCGLPCYLADERNDPARTAEAPQEVEEGPWAGFALHGLAGAQVALHVGPLPGRKAKYLYLNLTRPKEHPAGGTSVAYALARFTGTEQAQMALSFLEALTALTDAGEIRDYVETTIDAVNERLTKHHHQEDTHDRPSDPR